MTTRTRTIILEALHHKVATGLPIVGGGAGIGLSAKCAEEAGLDFIVIYNSGRYRMAGRSSMAGLMPYGNANEIVLEMGEEVLEVVRDIPVLAGVCATDPFRSIPRFLDQLKAMGFAGVQNYPTVCLFEGIIRANLEETGLGFDREVAMTAAARERDLLTAAYVASVDEAVAMAQAGADILVPHMGLTTSGMIGAKTAFPLGEAVGRITEMLAAIRKVRDDAFVICHGGPIAGPDEVTHMLAAVPGLQGFLGASSMERLPTEVAMTEHMRSYTRIPLARRA